MRPLKEYEVVIQGNEGEEIVAVYPTRVRYVQNGWFTGYLLIEKYGVEQFLQFADSMDVVEDFLYSVLRKSRNEIQTLCRTMTIRNLEDIIAKARIINGVSDEFQLHNVQTDTQTQQNTEDGLSLYRSIAVLFVHVGGLSQNQILNMEYPFFRDVMKELSIKLNYDAISNIIANPFAEKGWELVQNANPFHFADDGDKKQRVTLQSLYDAGLIEKDKGGVNNAGGQKIG